MTNTVVEKLSNGNIITYKKVNDIAYRYETDDKVVFVLEHVRQSNKRIRIYLGDTETGQSWHEINDIMGYVSNSTGNIKIPILVHNTNSMGGGAILDNRIIKIVETKTNKTLYEHSNFRIGNFDLYINNNELKEKGYLYGVSIDGKCYANFKDKDKALKWIEFMKGKRNSK